MYNPHDALNPFDDEDEIDVIQTSMTHEDAAGGIPHPLSSEPGTPVLLPPSSRTRIYHPNSSGQREPGGLNHLERMNRDMHADLREENVYYPFASESEWELAKWLSSGALSQKEINQYLRLQRVRKINSTS